MKVQYISILLVAVLMMACEKEIKFNRSKAEPLITLNGVVMADSVISIHLSKTRFFLESTADMSDIENAEVVLTSGAQTENMKHMGNGVYTAVYIPQVGDNVKISASAPQLSTVSSSATLLAHPNVGDIVVEAGKFEPSGQEEEAPDGWLPPGYKNVKVKIPLNDVREEQNYYRLIVRRTEVLGNTYSREMYLTDFDDPVFKMETPEEVMGMTEYTNRYAIFSDVRFNGTTYSLTFTDKVWHSGGFQFPERLVYEISVQHLSHDYFMYLRTRNAYLDSDSEGNLFMEPIQIYSNIEKGTGILGSATVTQKIVEVPF